MKAEVLFLNSQYKELKKYGRLKVDKKTDRTLGSYDKTKRLGHGSDEGGKHMEMD